MSQPLAERIRPQTLKEYIGQPHLLHENSILQNAIRRLEPFSIIFWGPPGTGKTTLARIVAREFDCQFFQLSAVSSGVKQLRELIQTAEKLLPQRSILFIDEIHRYSKSQQDALLHAVESGLLTLIGATTENPSFEVISPLLSRCRVLKIQAFSETELGQILDRAIAQDADLQKLDPQFDAGARELLIQSAGGDARKMLNSLSLACSLKQFAPVQIKQADIFEANQNRNQLYDKTGDYHYDTISAFIKSVRGSDPDAALYWLAIMIEGGEKPEFIARRLLILAAEDIGLADPFALTLAQSGMQTVQSIGMPESRIVLSELTIYLAAAPKSNSACSAIDRAQAHIREKGAKPVPLQLRNSPTKLMKDLGYGKKYRYPHNHDGHFVRENYFPSEVKRAPKFYIPGKLGREKSMAERLRDWWKNRFFGEDSEKSRE